MASACGACGFQASADAWFCPQCGRPLRAGTPVRRRTEPRAKGPTRPTGAGSGLEFAAEGQPIRPRPAAQVARRPLAFPSPLGAVLMIGGSALAVVGALLMTIPEGSIRLFGFGGGRTLPLLIGLLLLLVTLAGRSSPSPVVRITVVAIAAALAIVSIIDTRRLAGAPRGPGIGVILIGAVLGMGGTFLREGR